MSTFTTSRAQTGFLDAPGRLPPPTEQGAGFIDAFNRAKQNTPTFLAIELAAGRGYERQPGFELTDAKVRPLLEEVTQDLWPAYGDAVSDEHLRDIHVQNLLRLQNRTEIAKSGISGIAGAILADFTDPAMLAAGVLTGGYGFLAKGAQTARAVALARTGLISGTAFGSIEAFRQSQQPTGDPFAVMEAALGGGLGGVASGLTAQSGRLARALAQGSSQAVATPAVRSLDPDADAHQVAVSTGVGFLLGAFGGAISKESAAAMDKSVRWMIRDAEYGDVAASGFTLSEDGKAYFKTQLDPRLNDRRVADSIEIVNEPFDDVAIKRSAASSGSPEFAFAATEVPVDRSLATSSRRQFKQAPPPGFRAVSGEEQIAARLSSDGFIEVGDKFFGLSPEERTAAIKDAASGGVESPFLLEAAKRYVQEKGYISPTDLAQEFGIVGKDGVRRSRFTPEQAKTFADRLTAIAMFEMRQQGREPIPQTAVSIEEASQKLADLGLPADTIARAQEVSQSKGEVSASRIANKLKIGYADAQVVADTLRMIGTPYILRPKQELLSGSSRSRTATVPVSPSAASNPRPAAQTIESVSTGITQAVGATTPGGVKSPFGKVWTIAPEGDDWRFSANDASARGQWAFVPEPFRAINLRLGDSKSPMARMVANAWGRDFLPKSDGALAEGASTWIDFTFKKKVRAVNDSLVSAEAELAKNGVNLTKDQFDDAAFLDIAVGNGAAPPAARRYVDTVRTNFKEMLDYQKRSGTISAVDVPDDPNYVPHVHIAPLIEENVGKHGLDPMIDAYAGAIRSQMVKMGRTFKPSDDTLIKSMAKAIIKSGGQVSRGDHARIVSLDVAVVDALRSVGADDAMIARAVDMLEQMAPAADDVKILKRIQQEADPVERAKLEKQLKKRASDTNAPTNLKRRIPLDVAYEHPMPDGSKLRIRDMMEKDLYVLSRNYTRRALGSGVLATTLRGIEPETNPIEPMSSLDDLIRRYRTEAESLGVNRDKIETEAKLIETMGRNILGLPHYDASKPWVVNAVRLSRVSRNTVQSMALSSAWTGLTNFTEPMSAMFTALGPKMLKAMPNLAEIRQRALDGKIDAKMMRMADYYGMAINAGQRRLNTIAEFGAPTKSTTAYGRGLEKAERATGIAANIGHKISLQEITQDMGEFMAFHGIQDRWGQWAQSGKVPGRRALLPSGLADQPDMVQRIIDQGKKYHTTFKNSVGATIVDMQVENWDDLAARAAVMNSIRLEVRRKFVDTDLNGMPAFMSEEWAKPLTQFNSFMVASTRAKLGWAVAMKDPEAFQIMMANTALVGTLYTLRVYADSQFQDDPEKYREERLAPGKIMAAAVGRSAWTSLFPRIADTTLALGGQDAVFSAMRTSGIDPSVQVPVLDYARRLSKVPGALINPALRDDHDFSQADLQTIKRALIPNAINQFGAIDRLANYLDLPERSK
jgi:hypothetical protein